MDRFRVLRIVGQIALAAVAATVVATWWWEEARREREGNRQKLAIEKLMFLASSLGEFAAHNQGRYPAPSSNLGGRNAHVDLHRLYGRDFALIPDGLEVACRCRSAPLDPWGREFVYMTDSSGLHYVVMSFGGDGKQDSPATIGRFPQKESWRDIVVVDGRFAAAPREFSIAGLTKRSSP